MKPLMPFQALFLAEAFLALVTGIGQNITMYRHMFQELTAEKEAFPTFSTIMFRSKVLMFMHIFGVVYRKLFATVTAFKAILRME